jgi:hypothetical protein
MLLFVAATAAHAESYDEKVGATDRNDPDAVLELALWCKERKMFSRANRHFQEALRLDPNHEPTRTAMGFVYDGRRWVHESRLPKGSRPGKKDSGSSTGGGAVVKASGPGPKASEIEWDLTVPADPDTDGFLTDFLDGVLRNMNSQGNEFMDANIATLMKEEQLPSAVSRMAHAMKEGTYTDLYGPSMMMSQMLRDGGPTMTAYAKALLPFVMHASAKNTNAEDLYTFAYIAGSMGDKRVVPRLIELLGNPDDDVQFGAKSGLAAATMLDERELTVASAQAWWDKYHAASDAAIFATSLNDRDPKVRIRACQALYPSQDKRIVPVLIELARHKDRDVWMAAANEIAKITGNTWGLDRGVDAERREKIADQLENWWKEEKTRFTFVAFRGQDIAGAPATPKADPIAQWVSQLGDLDGKVAAEAQANLRRKGDEAVSYLIEGLKGKDGIVRNKCRDLLREISGENYGFEGIRGSDSARAAAIGKWEAWAAAR